MRRFLSIALCCCFLLLPLPAQPPTLAPPNPSAWIGETTPDEDYCQELGLFIYNFTEYYWDIHRVVRLQEIDSLRDYFIQTILDVQGSGHPYETEILFHCFAGLEDLSLDADAYDDVGAEGWLAGASYSCDWAINTARGFFDASGVEAVEILDDAGFPTGEYTIVLSADGSWATARPKLDLAQEMIGFFEDYDNEVSRKITEAASHGVLIEYYLPMMY